MSGARLIPVNGVDLRVETFGDPADPAILLIGGAASPMDRWADEFCRRLAEGLRFVIRYDSRDTGRSASDPAGAPRYTELDLAADAIGVLDALDVRTAHLVGISTGAALAQRIANDHPDRVASLVPPLAGAGHLMPPPAVWDELVPAVLRQTSGGWEEQGARLVARSYAGGDPTGWFDSLYAAGAAGEVPLPWDRSEPHPLLVEWAQPREPAGEGRRAIVVGCGLGADAEYVAGRGYETVAFDIAETAVRLARERNPGSSVRYEVADLLDLPDRWRRAFDLVVEIITVQALPDPPRRTAIANVGGLVAPGGTLFVIALRQADPAETVDHPPFPLTRDEIHAFAADGLRPVRIEETYHPPAPTRPRWRAEFHRPAG